MGASKKFGVAAVVGGAAAYVLGRLRTGRGPLVEYEGASGERARETDREAATPTPTTFDGDRATPSAQLDRSEPTPSVETEFHVDADELAARRTEQADQFVDVTADSAPLVSAERDALTVPGEDGEDHRRRDQTAGVQAQEIAAAQVRERRSGDAFLEDEDF